MGVLEWWVVAVPAVLAGGFWLLKRLGRRHAVADWGSGFLNHLDGLTRLFCARFHRLEHDPLPVPESGGAIVAANHLSGLDAILMIASCRRPLRFVIATEQYDQPLLRRLYDLVGCIPVDRTGSPEKAFYSARRALAEGQVIALFPQGAIRRPDESRKPLKRGVIALAAMAEVPIIPVRVSGVRGIGRTVTAVFIRSHAKIHAGTPLRVTGSRDERALLAIEEFISRDVYDDYSAYFDSDGEYTGSSDTSGSPRNLA